MNRRFSLLFVVLILSGLTRVFAGGGKDVNGLSPKDYDQNGWAVSSDGKWVASPNGAVYAETTEAKESNYSILNASFIETDNELDADESETIVYDRNGWAYVDGKWTASSDGALYKGQEKKNLAFLLNSEINRMGDMEKGLLKALLLYGNKIEKKLGDILGSAEKLAEYGQDVTGEWAAVMFEKAFTKGTGFEDALTGKSFNYGKQLDVACKKYVAKSLKLPNPKFTNAADTVEGALEREKWITEKFVENFVSSMTEEERLEIAKHIQEELRNEGVDLGNDFVKAFAAGGMSMIWIKGGIKPYLLMSKLTKKIGMFVFNRSLPFTVYTTLSTVYKRVFSVALPAVGIIFLAKTLYDIPGFINPREYDKFIPAVVLIGLSRFLQDDSMGLTNPRQ